MKILKSFIFGIFFVLIVSANGVSSFALEYPQLDAKSYIVMDSGTSLVLFEKNADERTYPASMTKLMTAIIATENITPETIITITEKDVAGLYEQGSAVNLKAGEEIPFSELLKYFLVASGNDAANAIARHISGDNDTFAKLMNEKAALLTCTGTNFTNPHGLHDDNHYTTARDMALIGLAAAKIPAIAEICAIDKISIAPTNKHPDGQTFTSTNYLISRYKDNRYVYSGATGLKTGWTGEAGMCLTATATKGDLNVLSVVMGAPKRADGSLGSFSETTKLLDFTFKNFESKVYLTDTEPMSEIPIALGKDREFLVLSLQTPYRDTLPLGIKREDLNIVTMLKDDISAPIDAGEVLGSATISYNGQVRQTINLISSVAVERSSLSYVLSLLGNFFGSIWFKIIFVSLVLIFVLLLIVRQRNINRRRRRSRRYR